MRLSIIIVNYQSRVFLEKCLHDIAFWAPESLSFEVVLVNNDTEELTVRSELKIPPKIINSPTNCGFAAASNLGARSASGKYLLFLNPDLELPDNSLFFLPDQLEKQPSAGIIGPKIIDKARHAPQPWTCGSTTTLGSVLLRNTIGKPWNRQTEQRVDWLSGTALLISKELFQRLGGFDEGFFMYYEDQDLCLRAGKEGKKILFHPQATVIHHNGQSWSDKTEQKRHYSHSQDRFFSKHRPAWELFVLRTIRNLFTFHA